MSLPLIRMSLHSLWCFKKLKDEAASGAAALEAKGPHLLRNFEHCGQSD
jgi:hypothetical protein